MVDPNVIAAVQLFEKELRVLRDPEATVYDKAAALSWFMSRFRVLGPEATYEDLGTTEKELLGYMGEDPIISAAVTKSLVCTQLIV